MSTTEHPIRAARKRLGLTQEDLAKAVGVAISTICRLERRERQGSIGTLRAIARALGVEISEILVDEE